MQNETDLVGERGAATGAIRGKLALVELDEVLSLTAGTIESVVQPFSAAAGDVGDDEADIEALGRRLDARGHASLAVPGLGAVTRLGIAAQRHDLFLSAANSHIIGDLFDQAVEDFVAGKPRM